MSPASTDRPPLPAPHRGPTIFPLAISDLVGLAALQVAAVLAFVRLDLALLPLALFAVACGAASLMPRSRFFLPVRSRGRTGRRVVALTFDDGPDPATTPRLLALLARRGIPATFFVPGVRADRHPDLVRAILAAGHDVGNHSYHHDPLLMLRSRATLEREVEDGQQALRRLGATPLTFRPPVGVTNPRLWRILLARGLTCVTFSRRAGDFGNRRLDRLADRLLRRIRPDDVVMLHDVAPAGGLDVDRWLAQVEAVLDGLRARDLAVVPLATLLGQPVTLREERPGAGNPAASFYDGLAATYDEEQGSAAAALAPRVEDRVVRRGLEAILDPDARVLELGAGTGRFTLDLARRCREVVAVDVSTGMLAALSRKVAAAGLANVRCVVADAADLETEGRFDLICSFSALEYVPDLGPLLARLTPLLAPGGHLYLTTAHRGFFRWFAQIGNALRQGLWLHARGRREMRRLLAEAGLEVEVLETHVLRLPLLGGMLLEVRARRG